MPAIGRTVAGTAAGGIGGSFPVERRFLSVEPDGSAWCTASDTEGTLSLDPVTSLLLVRLT